MEGLFFVSCMLMYLVFIVKIEYEVIAQNISTIKMS